MTCLPACRRAAVAVLCLAAIATGGCTQDFAVRRVRPGSAAATARAADPSTGWTAAQCLGALKRNDPTDRRQAATRLVDLYASALLAAPAHTLTLPTGTGRTFRLGLRPGEGPGGVKPSEFTALEPVDRFVVTKVERFNRVPGEGAPLVGRLQPVFAVNTPGPVPSQPVEGLVRAVTAVPVVTGRRDAPNVALALYDPHTTGRLPSGRPLAADYTTPFALELAHFRPQRRGLLGLIRGGDYFPSTGLYPTENPTPDKTPLVLVHGLISDPSDFSSLTARLEANEDVRRRYQICFFYYPTSLPVVYAATLLREDVELLVHRLDPDGTHPAMHRAVLVGHSMGGLLCRMAVSDGGDTFYHHFFRQPMEQLKLGANDRALLQRAFYYRSDPDVARVVFIATPHRGSHLVGGLPGTIGRLLLHMPASVVQSVQGILTVNRTALKDQSQIRPGSSLDSLAPRGPVISAVNEMPLRPGVALHSILGDRGRPGPREASSDGVVPYASSHLPPAVSEVMVPAGHTGTLHRPETAAEIIRVLGGPDETRP